MSVDSVSSLKEHRGFRPCLSEARSHGEDKRMAYRYRSRARLLAMVLVASSILLFSLPRASAVWCTAKGLATGVESCLSSAADKDDCCDYVINDIVYPCGITEICGLDLGSEVQEFFDYCRFKCHGLRPRLSASS